MKRKLLCLCQRSEIAIQPSKRNLHKIAIQGKCYAVLIFLMTSPGMRPFLACKITNRCALWTKKINGTEELQKWNNNLSSGQTYKTFFCKQQKDIGQFQERSLFVKHEWASLKVPNRKYFADVLYRMKKKISNHVLAHHMLQFSDTESTDVGRDFCTSSDFISWRGRN